MLANYEWNVGALVLKEEATIVEAPVDETKKANERKTKDRVTPDSETLQKEKDKLNTCSCLTRGQSRGHAKGNGQLKKEPPTGF